jgi:hypothetical protein
MLPLSYITVSGDNPKKPLSAIVITDKQIRSHGIGGTIISIRDIFSQIYSK